MNELGYNQFICDIFSSWENVKDEILISERKSGTGNGTIHVFLGAADNELRLEFPTYYKAVENGENPSIKAVPVKHFFVTSNLISMIGHTCQYHIKRHEPFADEITNILQLIERKQSNELLETTSLFKLSTGSNKLRPYFKQFETGGIFTDLVRKLLLPNSAYKISLLKDENDNYAAFWLIGFSNFSDFESDSNNSYLNTQKPSSNPREWQVIYYGAPGTGKSHEIKRLTEEAEEDGRVFRTTFHPDTDYSTFVGCYKPTMKPVDVTTIIGKEAVPVMNGGERLQEQRIVYAFTAQAFVRAYVEAWRTTQPVYLVIEEINRGNCAQIFGDLFQLLDRDSDGCSEYAIDADTDLQRHLADALDDSPRDDVPATVRSGQKLMLPGNLYIWATMNTSDQSLFPIDSAFKRRWQWRYIPIADAGRGYRLRIGGDTYDWWEFLKAINARINHATSSEDKKLGYFFAKADEATGEIAADQFVGKVLFYLWNDVFKNYGFESEIFNKEDGNKIEFSDFFTSDGSPNEATVTRFLHNLSLSPTHTPEDELESTN